MKKLSILHILNGDATIPAFKSANLPGKVLVWREILSEGPAAALLPEQEFWQNRQAYITDIYHESAEVYQQKVLQELPKLDAAGNFFEVVLWFDADLMCQVNLLYLLQRLYHLRPKLTSLFTPPQSKSIGLMTVNELQLLFEERQQLIDLQLKQAYALWQLYAGPDPLKLQQYLTDKIIQLPNLGKALWLHLQRFPGCTTGLNSPEIALLELVQQEVITKKELMQKFWKQHPAYGYGDLQIEHILQRLKPLFVQDEEHITLSELGKQVLHGKKNYITESQRLGGVLIETNGVYCYNSVRQQLEEI